MHSNKQSGIALVIVLWVVTLLTLMAGSYAYSMRTETRLVTSASERAQARALADAGVALAALHLLIRPDPENPWQVEGSTREWQFGSGTVSISVRDATGLIDINQAARELIVGLLATAGGLGDQEAEALMQKIEDYRDSDNERRAEGAEEDDYAAEGRATPKNTLFESIDELQQVLGMTEEIYTRIADAITVDSRQKGINPETASAKVLNSIPNIDPQSVADYLVARQTSLDQDLPPPAFPEGAGFTISRQGISYQIQVAAKLHNSPAKDYIEASITRRRVATEAYHVNFWRAGPAALPNAEEQGVGDLADNPQQ